MATAAHDALVGLIPVGALPFAGFGSLSQQTAAIDFVNATYATDISTIPDGPGKTRGIAVGHAAAMAILARRSTDGATAFVPYTPGTNPGDWQPTPNPIPFDPPAAGDRLPAVLPWWGSVPHSFSDRPTNSRQTGHRPLAASLRDRLQRSAGSR